MSALLEDMAMFIKTLTYLYDAYLVTMYLVPHRDLGPLLSRTKRPKW